MNRIKWLLIEWENRSNEQSPLYGLVHVHSLVDPCKELHTGKLVFVAVESGEVRRAKVVMTSVLGGKHCTMHIGFEMRRSVRRALSLLHARRTDYLFSKADVQYLSPDDRRFLEQQLVAMEEHSRNAYESFVPSPISVPVMTLKSKFYPPSASSSWSQNESPADSESDSEERQPTYRAKRKNVQQIASRAKSNNIVTPHYQQAASSSSRHVTNVSQPIKYEHRIQYKSHPKVSSTPFPKAGDDSKNITVMMYDQGTQTSKRLNNYGMDTDMPQIDDKVSILERVIDEMEEKFSILEATIDSWTTGIDEAGTSTRNNIPKMEMFIQESNINNSHYEPEIKQVLKTSAMRTEYVKTHESTQEEFSEHEDLHLNDMVTIGTGGTVVPRHIINQIDWNSYTMATRKLLMAVFPRRTLATHSLTGKSSPAFLHKPAKLCLDPLKVNDIVITVTSSCNVKESLVRSAITTKCADENKMFRMRQEKYEKRQKLGLESRTNQENIPPPVASENQVG